MVLHAAFAIAASASRDLMSGSTISRVSGAWAAMLVPSPSSAVFDLFTSVTERAQRLGVGLPVVAIGGFDEAVGQLERGLGIELRQAIPHRRIEHIVCDSSR